MGVTPRKGFINHNSVRLKDALYNLHPTSGASVDYGRGIVVGIVSALLETGFTFNEAFNIAVMKNLPKDYRMEAIPQAWRNELKEGGE